MKRRGTLAGRDDHLGRIAEVAAGSTGARVQYPPGQVVGNAHAISSSVK
jgi:hypothetical protein